MYLLFQIPMPPEHIEQVRQRFAPPDDPVFELVPPMFDHHANILFESMGRPVINENNVWDVYNDLLHRFIHFEEVVQYIEEWTKQLTAMDSANEPLIQGAQVPDEWTCDEIDNRGYSKYIVGCQPITLINFIIRYAGSKGCNR